MSVIAPLKDLESNEDDSDVLKETERVMFEELSDRYSDQHTLHTGKPRLYIFFAMNEPHHVVPTVPCVRGWVCAHTLRYPLYSPFNQHQRRKRTSKEPPLLEVEHA